MSLSQWSIHRWSRSQVNDQTTLSSFTTRKFKKQSNWLSSKSRSITLTSAFSQKRLRGQKRGSALSAQGQLELRSTAILRDQVYSGSVEIKETAKGLSCHSCRHPRAWQGSSYRMISSRILTLPKIHLKRLFTSQLWIDQASPTFSPLRKMKDIFPNKGQVTRKSMVSVNGFDISQT